MLDAAVAKAGQPDVWLGIAQHARAFGGGLQHQRLGELEVAVIADADGNADADVAVGIGPIFHLLRHQILVGNQMFFAVAGDDADGAHADLVHPAETLTHDDDVARLDRAIHQQDDARDQIAERLLQAEADREAERAGKDGKGGEVDAEHVDANEEGGDDDGDGGEFLRQQLLGGVEAIRLANRSADQLVGETNEREQGDASGGDRQQAEQRDPAFAQADPDRVERCADGRETAIGAGDDRQEQQERQRQRGPARDGEGA